MRSFFEHVFVHMPDSFTLILDSSAGFLNHWQFELLCPNGSACVLDYTLGCHRPDSANRPGLFQLREFAYKAIALPSFRSAKGQDPEGLLRVAEVGRICCNDIESRVAGVQSPVPFPR